MSKRKATKLIHEGEYAAEVDVELIISGDDWSPYLSLVLQRDFADEDSSVNLTQD